MEDPLEGWDIQCPYCKEGYLDFVGCGEREYGTGQEYFYECDKCGVELEYRDIKVV